MAVYTAVPEAAVAAFVAEYDLGALVSFRGIAEGVENTNFLLRTARGDHVLTLYEKRVDPVELPWFLELMQHLSARGVDCPLPVAGRDGRALRALAGRPAAICTFLPGDWPRHPDAGHCAAIGRALAVLHAAGNDYAAERANGLGPDSWGPLLALCRAGGDALSPGLCAELDGHLDAVLDAWPAVGALPRGHIHADLFPDNAFFRGGRLTGIIDFYFACTDLLAYDLAVCLNSWCFAGPEPRLDPDLATAILDGYEAARPLTPAERDALPVLCAGAALRFLLTRLFDWTNTPADALVTRKDPLEYLARLRHFAARIGAEHAHAR